MERIKVLWRIAGENSFWNNESFSTWLLRRISYISAEQSQKRQELSVQCNDTETFIHIPSIVKNTIRLKIPNTKCVSLNSTVFFFLDNFALINMYRITFEILVQLHVGIHKNCPFLVSDFNHNWNVCKFQWICYRPISTNSVNIRFGCSQVVAYRRTGKYGGRYCEGNGHIQQLSSREQTYVGNLSPEVGLNSMLKRYMIVCR
jgi:hypothetical protein